MPQGVLSKTEAPPFDIMGLLLGGRGYASSWFQNRDKLRMVDIAAQKEMADRQNYAQGILASPQLAGQIKQPYDRQANWDLWGQLVSGPESFVQFGNQQLNQSTGAIYDREQSAANAAQQAANIKLSADEQLRVDMLTRERDATYKQNMLKQLFTPTEDGLTPGQAQVLRTIQADAVGIKAPEGYAISEGGNGFEPLIGGKVFNEMMNEGQAMSSMINSAEYLQNMLKTGQGDKDQWSAIKADMLLQMKEAANLGTLDEGVMKFYTEVVPDYYGSTGPELSNQIADKLAVDIKLWKNKLLNIGDKYRVPIAGFSRNKALGAEPANDEELMKRFPAGNPVRTPAPVTEDATNASRQGMELELLMGTLSQVHELPNGVTVGFDSDRDDWVEVDKQAFEGSTIGNIARGAGRSVESIGQGLREITASPMLRGTEEARERVAREGEELKRRQQAASIAAPTAEMVGGAVPDVAAGLGVAAATGGMGLPAMLAAETGLGAILGGVRPGTVQDRAQNAVMSSALALGGLALGPAAAKGIGIGLRMFSGMENRVLGRITETIETGSQASAAARQAEAAVQQPGSVGAARTPGGLIDDATAQETRLLDEGEEAGADLMDLPRMQQMAERAQELEMPTPIGFGSRAMSPARMAQAANELQPFGDVVNKRIMNTQKAKMSHYLSDALGIKRKDALFVDDLQDARAQIGEKFESVQKSLPNIDGADVVKALQDVGNSKAGVFGSFRSQKLIADAIENAKGRPILDAEEFMNTRTELSEQMADMFAKGQTASGEQLMAALNNLDKVATKVLKREGKERVASLWETARTQWRVLVMTDAPGAVNVGTGEINPLSLFNRMNKAPSRGGWRGARPEAGTPARKLYDSLEIGTASASMMPMTGARLGTLRALLQSNVGKTVAGGAGAASIWDAMN